MSTTVLGHCGGRPSEECPSLAGRNTRMVNVNDVLNRMSKFTGAQPSSACRSAAPDPQ